MTIALHIITKERRQNVLCLKNKTKKNRHFKLVKQENMLDSLNLSIMYVPKQKKIEFYISFIFTKKTPTHKICY